MFRWYRPYAIRYGDREQELDESDGGVSWARTFLSVGDTVAFERSFERDVPYLQNLWIRTMAAAGMYFVFEDDPEHHVHLLGTNLLIDRGWWTYATFIGRDTTPKQGDLQWKTDQETNLRSAKSQHGRSRAFPLANV